MLIRSKMVKRSKLKVTCNIDGLDNWASAWRAVLPSDTMTVHSSRESLLFLRSILTTSSSVSNLTHLTTSSASRSNNL